MTYESVKEFLKNNFSIKESISGPGFIIFVPPNKETERNILSFFRENKIHAQWGQIGNFIIKESEFQKIINSNSPTTTPTAPKLTEKELERT